MIILKIYSIWILLYGIWEVTIALKEVQVFIPPAVIQGHKAVLNCLFDLEGDKLYAVKWYKGVSEFYRFSPNGNTKTFKIKGFHVVEKESNATQVVLKHVTRAISGRFSCEVTTDQPGFLTDMKTGNMEVVELPKLNPSIAGIQSRYKINDLLRGTCTSEKSFPGSNLTWYFNGRQMNGSHIHNFKRGVDQYVTSYSTIRIKLDEHMFNQGKLKVRCSASIFDVYHRSEERSIECDKLKYDDTTNIHVNSSRDFSFLFFETSSSSNSRNLLIIPLCLPVIISCIKHR